MACILHKEEAPSKTEPARRAIRAFLRGSAMTQATNAEAAERQSPAHETATYETPRVLATYDANDILAEAETGSIVIIVG